jgi:SAM-dependent methyltransferase
VNRLHNLICSSAWWARSVERELLPWALQGVTLDGDVFVCFTMLHHIPSRELQDRALTEAARVLRPGGVFAGSDSVGGGALFRAIHVGDTLNLVDPDTFGKRVTTAGFAQPHIDISKRSLRWHAVKPR